MVAGLVARRRWGKIDAAEVVKSALSHRVCGVQDGRRRGPGIASLLSFFPPSRLRPVCADRAVPREKKAFREPLTERPKDGEDDRLVIQ